MNISLTEEQIEQLQSIINAIDIPDLVLSDCDLNRWQPGVFITTYCFSSPEIQLYIGLDTTGKVSVMDDVLIDGNWYNDMSAMSPKAKEDYDSMVKALKENALTFTDEQLADAI